MNLKQLSHMLSLSQTTVSRALNGYPEVSEETRRRVMDAAKRHGYRPNPSARCWIRRNCRKPGACSTTKSEAARRFPANWPCSRFSH